MGENIWLQEGRKFWEDGGAGIEAPGIGLHTFSVRICWMLTILTLWSLLKVYNFQTKFRGEIIANCGHSSLQHSSSYHPQPPWQAAVRCYWSSLHTAGGSHSGQEGPRPPTIRLMLWSLAAVHDGRGADQQAGSRHHHTSPSYYKAIPLAKETSRELNGPVLYLPTLSFSSFSPPGARH